MTTPALLPCPFCGGTLNNDADPNEWGLLYVECQDCGARGPTEDYSPSAGLEASRARAAAAWNQRSAWQPIETALGDGSEVFVWDGAKAVVAVSEHDFVGDVIHWPLDEWGDKRRDQPPVHGTHWQPLPSPPPITP